MSATPPPPTFWDSLRRWLGLAPAEEPAIATLEPISEADFGSELRAAFGQIDTTKRVSVEFPVSRREKDGVQLAFAIVSFLLMAFPSTEGAINMKTSMFVPIAGRISAYQIMVVPNGVWLDANQIGGAQHVVRMDWTDKQTWTITVEAENGTPTRTTLTAPPVRPSADPLDAERAITLWLFRQPAFQEALIAMVQWGRAVQALEAEEAARAAKEAV